MNFGLDRIQVSNLLNPVLYLFTQKELQGRIKRFVLAPGQSVIRDFLYVRYSNHR
jgi:hypothetical protein